MTVCGEDAVRLFQELRPDLLLLDLRLPGMSGLESLQASRRESSQARCVILTTYERDEDIYRALLAGAAGYIIRVMPYEILVEASRRVYAGNKYLPPPVVNSLANRTPNSDLSPREREVLSLIVSGRSNKQIAIILRITEATVKSHVSVILDRLGVDDRTQAVITALQRGLEHL